MIVIHGCSLTKNQVRKELTNDNYAIVNALLSEFGKYESSLI